MKTIYYTTTSISIITILLLIVEIKRLNKENEPWVDWAIDAQRWRECKWELPESRGNYLVFLTMEKDSSRVSHMMIMWYSKFDNGAFPSKWNTESLENEGYKVTVRYWQRLPQEPIVK